ncbi:MAG: hypothetical protein J3T61_08065 [Candidatus Brocadiales bacterium]|nr:hypothetical protein [Candidatus Bathyanammoxibius sp.]
MPSPYLTTLQHLAAKTEVTEGVDVSPADADVVAPVFDLEWVPTINVPDRNPVAATMSKPQRIAGNRSATLTFALELKGGGAAADVPPPMLSDLLKACGMVETINVASDVTYTPGSQDPDTVTLEVRQTPRDSADDNLVKKLLGARGTFSIVAVLGQVVLIQFEFQGTYVEPDTDADPLMYVTPSIAPTPVPFLSAAFTFQGVGSLLVANVTLDLANEVVMRQDVNNATGHTMAEIVNRAPIGSIDPEIVPDTVLNFFKQTTDDVEGILQYVLGTAVGNKVTVLAPKAQIITPAEADRDGIMVGSLDLSLNRGVSAGEDELSLKFE